MRESQVALVGVYWSEKWERVLEGLSIAELSVVAAVALKKRAEQKGGSNVCEG